MVASAAAGRRAARRSRATSAATRPCARRTRGRPRAASRRARRRRRRGTTTRRARRARAAAPPPRTRARRRASRPRGASRRAAGPRSSGRRPRTSPRRPCLRGRRPRETLRPPPSAPSSRRAASGVAATARRFRHGSRAGEVQQRVRGPGVVRREPGEVVDGAAQGHEHVLALDVAAEHRARGPGRREARVGLLVRLRARLVADGVRRVGRRERIRGDDARVPPVHHAPRLFGGGGGADVAAAAREEGDLLGGQEVAEHLRPELRREPRPLLAPAPLVLPGAARAAPRDSPPYPFQQQGREQRRQRVEQRPPRGARPGQGFVVLALRRRERRERVELVGEARRRLEDGVARADEEEDEPALPVSRLPYQLVLDARALLVRVDEEAEHVLCRRRRRDGAGEVRRAVALVFGPGGQGGPGVRGEGTRAWPAGGLSTAIKISYRLLPWGSVGFTR